MFGYSKKVPFLVYFTLILRDMLNRFEIFKNKYIYTYFARKSVPWPLISHFKRVWLSKRQCLSIAFLCFI